jgi:hypothetical protein
MKALKLTRAFGASFALVLVGFLAAQAGSVLPRPSVNGPSLGDPVTNLDSVVQALQNNTTSNFTSFTTLTVGAGAATSTALAYGFNFLTAASGTTPGVTLPQAKPGADVVVVNNTGQGLNLFAGATPFTAGGIDYINGVAGTTPYVQTSNGKSVQCIVPQGGNWWCVSGL